MIDIHPEDLQTVKQILQQFIPGLPVWIFGSRIKNIAKSYSDLDLVIVADHKISLITYYKLKDAFEESNLPYKVDILDWHRIDHAFRQVIQQEHVVLL